MFTPFFFQQIQLAYYLNYKFRISNFMIYALDFIDLHYVFIY